MGTSKKGVRFVLLVEDKAIERFVRGVLVAFGFSLREMRVITYPVGKGSAKQWIEKEYKKEVQAHRSRNYQPNIVLVVGTDADEHSVQQRIQKLSDSRTQEKLSNRTANEKIVLWIPKRNIETWLHYLNKNDVNEETDYKHRVSKPKFNVLGQEFVTQYHQFLDGETQNLLPSLKTAFEETKQRLPWKR